MTLLLRLPWVPRSAAAFLLVLALAALLGPSFSRHDYQERVGPALQAPGTERSLGTDDLGRDVLVRLMYAGRLSLAVGLAGALLAAVVGTGVGLAAGLAGRWIDSFLMRSADMFLAVPALPALLILAAVDLEKPLGALQHVVGGSAADVSDMAHAPAVQAVRIVIVLALFSWMGVARLVRAQILSLRQAEFVLAARAAGASGLRIGVRHLLPHCFSPILVATATAVASNILYEAVLGFLGLGIPPPVPTWGSMLQSARVYSYYRAPWLIYFPGLCITATVLCTNILADYLNERADPRRT
jgi:peptide/nickel transport system permease protein